MDSSSNHSRNEHLAALVNSLSELSDDDFLEAWRSGLLGKLIQSLAPPVRPENSSFYDYALSNKLRLAWLAQVRLWISTTYSAKGWIGKVPAYTSPWFNQWFDDSVLLLQGESPFEGLICKYKDGELSFATSAVDKQAGEEIGPGDLVFTSINEVVATASRSQRPHQDAVEQLDYMLQNAVSVESEYQQFLELHPWIFGLQYHAIQRHGALDDRNIPDFTGVRTLDGARDVFEIKQPFLKLFRSGGSFTAEFNDAIHQAERYLHFVDKNAGYLMSEKGLRFENAKAVLVVGYKLTRSQLDEIRRKERMNPRLSIVTFDSLLQLARETAGFLRLGNDKST